MIIIIPSFFFAIQSLKIKFHFLFFFSLYSKWLPPQSAKSAISLSYHLIEKHGHL